MRRLCVAMVTIILRQKAIHVRCVDMVTIVFKQKAIRLPVDMVTIIFKKKAIRIRVDMVTIVFKQKAIRLPVDMYSTGCPYSSGSCSVLVPWSGGVSWVLLRPTSEIFAIPPRAPEDAVH